MSGWLILSAFVLSLVLIEPRRIPHPVIGIGRLVEKLEIALAVLENRRRAGILLVVLTLTLTGLGTALILWAASAIHPFLAGVIALWIAYTGFALRSVHKETAEVVGLVQSGRVQEARRALSLIVGRETRTLSEEEIIKACIESLAENTSSSLVAPLFYLSLGGPVALMVYQAVTTLDSMVGYLTERYRELGWAAARLDDLANWIPARLTALLMISAAFSLGLNGFNAVRIMLRDARKHRSPNAGWPEAAAAGALGVQLGGPAIYFGEQTEKAVLGEPDRSATSAEYHRMVRLTYVTAALAVILGLLLHSWIWG
ncbi:adenosylcobinamide-phosphate synthase CbiB [Geoalkalibacter subterraneus]|uniref:Cobalamin biosynthesis protein CobD n=1 Tax=Geoalkalibacter subterraneus TaxID=483547 RepID=A0A0B5FGX5_9BACT|nr:adenosylcobinamide-phosphate synthase CbiB [Geoalkalibacter subterraneus]AJF07412.1 hypothetical protein GSUB_13715 [Geoalkalibacter subterraneus]